MSRSPDKAQRTTRGFQDFCRIKHETVVKILGANDIITCTFFCLDDFCRIIELNSKFSCIRKVLNFGTHGIHVSKGAIASDLYLTVMGQRCVPAESTVENRMVVHELIMNVAASVDDINMLIRNLLRKTWVR